MPSEEDLRRLENDVATIKAALGTELPYDRSHVAMHLLTAGAALPLLGLPLLGLEQYAGAGVLFYVMLLGIAWALQLRHLRRRQDEAPVLWRWGRKELIGSLVAIALLVGYFIWVSTLGRWRGEWGLREALQFASAIFFFLGTTGLAWIAVDRARWPGLGWSLALVTAGALFPLAESRTHLMMILGIMALVGGLSSGLLQWWQIRRHEVAHAD